MSIYIANLHTNDGEPLDICEKYIDSITEEVDWIAWARDEDCSPCSLAGFCVGGDCPFWVDCSRCGSVMPDPT